jgi:hypothetical protein
METSYLIARIFAGLYIAAGLGILTNGTLYRRMIEELERSATFTYLAGLMTFLMGALIVSFHNIWSGWPTVITVLGWLALVKGAVLLIRPQILIRLSRSLLRTDYYPKYGGVFAILLGLLFAYWGWCPVGR